MEEGPLRPTPWASPSSPNFVGGAELLKRKGKSLLLRGGVMEGFGMLGTKLLFVGVFPPFSRCLRSPDFVGGAGTSGCE